MVITHNLPALNAWNRLNKNNKNSASTLQKLSSGQRINCAADDAAGLAISEKMRSQIRGLSQATRNAQDGISLIQTAEGGMGSIHESLQRMRELCVQGANGTLTDDDREKVQLELDQLKSDVNTTSTNTKFNGISLLNGIHNVTSVSGSSSPNLALPNDNSVISTSVFVGDKTIDFEFQKDSNGNVSITAKNSGTTLATTTIHTQPVIEWQKSIGGTSLDQGQSIIATSDGGFVVANVSNSNNGDVSGNKGGYDYWITKHDSSGNLQWQKSFGGGSTEEPYSIKQTSDGGFVITGSTTSNNGDVSGNHSVGTEDYWVAKLDSTGNLQWQKTLGGTNVDVAKSVIQTSDGGYMVTGFSASADGDVASHLGGAGTRNMWFVKLDSSGNTQWEKSANWFTFSEARSIQQTSDNGFIVAGSNDDGAWLVKLNSIGNVQWTNTVGSGGDYFNDIQISSDGGFIVAGNDTNSVVKFDSSGNIEWQKSFAQKAYSIKQTSDGYIVGGGDNDYWLAKLDTSGNTEWQKTLGGTGVDTATGIMVTSAGDYILTGGSASNNGDVTGNHGNYDCWLVKVNNPYNSNTVSMDLADILDGLLTYDFGNTTITFDSSNMNTIATININADIEDRTGIALQVGANAGNSINITIPDVSAEGIGLINGYPKVHPASEALTSITLLDTAIGNVSSERSTMGALQNRLEHIINNLTNAEENLTASESRIRDADMAKEMMDMVKNNILTQATQSMLAQANQQPQGVLQLLK